MCHYLGNERKDTIFFSDLFMLWSDSASLYSYFQRLLTMQRSVFVKGKKRNWMMHKVKKLMTEQLYVQMESYPFTLMRKSFEFHLGSFHMGGSILGLRVATQSKWGENWQTKGCHSYLSLTLVFILFYFFSLSCLFIGFYLYSLLFGKCSFMAKGLRAFLTVQKQTVSFLILKSAPELIAINNNSQNIGRVLRHKTVHLYYLYRVDSNESTSCG